MFRETTRVLSASNKIKNVPGSFPIVLMLQRMAHEITSGLYTTNGKRERDFFFGLNISFDYSLVKYRKTSLRRNEVNPLNTELNPICNLRALLRVRFST